MPIGPQDVAHVARLARLTLTDDERRLMAEQLGRIIAYVDQLRALDLEGAEPLTHPLAGLVNVFREDEVRPGLEREEALRGAPDRDGPFFRVPAVLEAPAGGGAGGPAPEGTP